ncbi:MAG: anion transporter [Deltaproteobacteria bacterium]|nr:anion transporter [Deltaproteobacteria bacterium]
MVALVQARGLPTRPFLFAVAMGSNAGSALTLAGNPQNMLVAKLSSLAYRDYLAAAALPAGGALVITAALLHLLFRRDLAVGTSHAPAPASDRDPVLLYVALASLAGVVVANLLGASLALSALAGAAAVLVVARRRAELLLARVDWSILLFFAGLFVVVAALQRTGLPAQWLASLTPPPAEATGVGSLGVLCAVLLLGSQIVSNVPLILLLEPWIRSFPDAPLVWTVTALVSTLAGNLTLLGSVANIIVIERARERLGFFEYLKVGVLVTTASTAFALLSLWLLW